MHRREILPDGSERRFYFVGRYGALCQNLLGIEKTGGNGSNSELVIETKHVPESNVAKLSYPEPKFLLV